MKKIIISLLCMLFPSFCLAYYDASEGWYVSLNSGYSINSAKNSFYDIKTENYTILEKSTKVDNNLAFILGVGKQITNNFRASIDFVHLPNFKLVDLHKRKERKNNEIVHMYFNTDLSAQIIMTNLHYDFTEFQSITPFLSAGCGLAYNKIADTQIYQFDRLDLSEFGASKTNFAWNVGGGISYQVNKKLSIELSYRFINYGKATTHKDFFGHETEKLHLNTNDNIEIKKLRSNQLLLGIKFKI